MNHCFDQYISEVSGAVGARTNLTFAGVLGKFWDAMVEDNHWNKESTRLQHQRDYTERILPALENRDNKTIDQYTLEDYQKAIAKIEQMKQSIKRASRYQPYAESTIQTFRRLIRVVVKIAAKNNLCDDILWGTVFADTESNDRAPARVNPHTKLKRSFRVKEEVEIAKRLLSADVDGESMGLLLMFSLGLRNSESCGISFGDIRPMFSHPECFDLYVYETTMRGSNDLQAGGKTRNVGRIIPIPSRVLALLLERKKMVQEYLQQISSNCNVDTLPIACKGHDYLRRCSARDLTTYARFFFRSLNFSEKILIQIEKDLTSDLSASMLKEKEPTAYLFRRNFATHLLILGLSEAEIQYIIGHDVEDLYETRNEFVNEERRFSIRQKMMQRPILNDLPEVKYYRVEENSCVSISVPPSQDEVITAPLEEGQIYLRVAANEPMDSLKVNFSSDYIPKPLAIEVSSGSHKIDYNRSIHIIRAYQESYLRSWKHLDADAT